MATFFQILGILSAVVLLLLVGFLVDLWRRLRGGLKGLGNTCPSPATISLALDPDPRWSRTNEVKAALLMLESCGYTQGPAYAVEGMPGVNLIALSHPAGAFACYYQHDAAGHWTDLCVNFTDDLELTISNAPEGHQIDTRPDTEKISHRGKTPAELHSVLLERLRGGTIRAVGLATFKEEFETAYRKDMAWRNGREGITEAEFRRVADEQVPPVSEEQLSEAFKECKLQELQVWSAELIAVFEDSTNLSVSEWKRYQDRVFIFRESFHPGAFLDYLTEIVPLADEAADKYVLALEDGIKLSELLIQIAADSGHQFLKLGQVEQPIETEIYGVIQPPETQL